MVNQNTSASKKFSRYLDSPECIWFTIIAFYFNLSKNLDEIKPIH